MGVILDDDDGDDNKVAVLDDRAARSINSFLVFRIPLTRGDAELYKCWRNFLRSSSSSSWDTGYSLANRKAVIFLVVSNGVPVATSIPNVRCPSNI